MILSISSGLYIVVLLSRRYSKQLSWNDASFGNFWQCGFTHLFTYGASYYSYTWSRLIANRIWEKLFDRKYNYELDDAWRSGGDLLQKELLSVGGGRNAWDCLNNMNILKNGEMETKTLSN
jgi:intermediate peptidase